MSEFSKNVKIIESRLRIMTWNIWWRFGPWVQREPAILQCIADLNPDVIALQEVWGDGATHFAEKVADRLGYQHVFASIMDMKDFQFGNALLSRWPIVKDDFTMLFGEKETGKGRLALFAEVNGPHGNIPVFSTHLNWKYEQSHIRQCQVTDLARFVDQKRPYCISSNCVRRFQFRTRLG
jgi:endonuclease/exonuclease/phosphatase family metal-dependent hydrolase